jgi:putative FmdB family regulatory protein
MPLHEYICQDCDARFESITSSAKADEVACPMCRSTGTRRLISVIAGVGGRTVSGIMDSGYLPGASGGGGCCGGAGGCACR